VQRAGDEVAAGRDHNRVTGVDPFRVVGEQLLAAGERRGDVRAAQ
jgi:hypothetical protein